MTKIWNTKYCLTSGITTHDAEIKKHDSMAVIAKTKHSFGFMLHGEGRDWHISKESAVKRAEEMKIKKLISLDKQIKKISAIEF